MPTKKKDRADRILILLALAVLLGSSSLFYFDDWMWGGRRRENGKIGMISVRSGDVRMKFTGDLKWQKASGGQDLIYNDSIYVGEGSEAKLALGESEMTVSEKTLVVLRRENQTSFMNLSYGSLFGKIGKNEKIVIDTGDGHPIVMHSKNASEVVVRKVAGKTELDVVSGDAEINVGGKITKVSRASRVVLNKDEPAKVEAVAIELVKPLHSETLYSEQVGDLDFIWRWSSGQKPDAHDKFKVEFSSSPDFAKVASRREVAGQMETHFKAAQSVNYFYRVRGPHDEVSATERVNFVRMKVPVVLEPKRDSVFEASQAEPAVIGMNIEKDPAAKLNYQIASDFEFKNIVNAESSNQSRFVRSLPEGHYFVRAQAAYNATNATSWSEPVGFAVNRKLEAAPLGPELTEATKILIPNREYPEQLYQASPQQTSNYLSRHGLLKNFFPPKADNYDQLNLAYEMSNGESQTLTRTNSAWPTEKMKPGRYTFKYQYQKTGFVPSSWSKAEKLEIAMEPPRPLGLPSYSAPDAAGVSQARWAFTPLLFAKSYDVELASNPRLKDARAIEVYKAEVVAKVKGENYYRVRARDAHGRLISDFSPIYKLEGGIPAALAKAETPAARKPSAVENTTSTKVEVRYEEPVHKSGWWAWVGGGENYVDYKQTAQGRLSFDDHHIKGPSEYVEAGFIGDQSLGGVVSFSFTPEDINPANAQIDHNDYNWTTISAEAFARKSNVFSVFGSPVSMDLRMGFQQTNMPFVFVDAFGDVYLKNNAMTTASIGTYAEMRREKWTYSARLRYEYPFSTKADGASEYSISPVINLDGGAGAAYNFTQRLRVGMFVNGQLQEFNYSYSDGTVVNHGLQTIFFSNIDFRLGYEF